MICAHDGEGVYAPRLWAWPGVAVWDLLVDAPPEGSEGPGAAKQG